MTKRAKLIVKDTTAIGHFHVNLNHVSQLPQPALFFHLFCKRTQMARVFSNARCPLCRSTEGNSKLTQTSENHPLALFCPDPPVDSQGKGQCFHYTSSLWRYTHTHTHLTSLFPGLPGWAGSRKVKPIWILLKQETVSGSGISWAICKSAPRSRQITTPSPHHSVFYRPDALPATQPTASKHWRQLPDASTQ